MTLEEVVRAWSLLALTMAVTVGQGMALEEGVTAWNLIAALERLALAVLERLALAVLERLALTMLVMAWNLLAALKRLALTMLVTAWKLLAALERLALTMVVTMGRWLTLEGLAAVATLGWAMEALGQDVQGDHFLLSVKGLLLHFRCPAKKEFQFYGQILKCD